MFGFENPKPLFYTVQLRMRQKETEERDKEFLAGIASGSTVIIDQVYELYFKSIAQYVLKNSGTMEDAKDIFQDAMMIIYEKLKQPDFELRYALHTYLFTICRNTWLKKLRKKSDKEVTFPEHLELINEETFEEEILWREKELLYREKFKMLGEECQKVLQLFLKGSSMKQIAKNANLASEGYAKKRKYQCKNKLLKFIQNDRRYQNLIEL